MTEIRPLSNEDAETPSPTRAPEIAKKRLFHKPQRTPSIATDPLLSPDASSSNAVVSTAPEASLTVKERIPGPPPKMRRKKIVSKPRVPKKEQRAAVHLEKTKCEQQVSSSSSREERRICRGQLRGKSSSEETGETEGVEEERLVSRSSDLPQADVSSPTGESGVFLIVLFSWVFICSFPLHAFCSFRILKLLFPFMFIFVSIFSPFLARSSEWDFKNGLLKYYQTSLNIYRVTCTCYSRNFIPDSLAWLPKR